MQTSSVAPVIVGVDGSPASMSAVRGAAVLASLYDLPLQVIHVFNWLPRLSEHDDGHRGTTANDLIEHAVTAAQAVSPCLAISTRLMEGEPTSILLRQARTAELLAIGDGEMLSHVCLPARTSPVKIAARARCSVLVARAVRPSGKSLVVGVDGSPGSERALDLAFETAARSGADLVVVKAETSPTETDDTHAHSGELHALNDLVGVREDKYGVAARIRMLPGEPADVLLAESRQAAFFIVGARGQQPYGGLLGSAAQTLLHHSQVPLILVRNLMTPRPGLPDQRPATAEIDLHDPVRGRELVAASAVHA